MGTPRLEGDERVSFARFQTSWISQTGVTIDLKVDAPNFAFLHKLGAVVTAIEDLMEAEDNLQLGPE